MKNKSNAQQKQTAEDAKVPQQGVEGEGSYTGTRRYNEHLKQHIEKGGVEDEAERARQALEGDEKEDLEEAERRGKRGPSVGKP